MSTEMPKAYEPQDVEDRIYQYWLDEGVFHAEVDPEKEPFCIVIPPPNVTGVLHMGHALDESIQDLLTRWHRMRGHEALWLPGTDHAGIATQNVVEERIAEEGLSRHDLGREKFLERVWEVKEDHQSGIREQLKRFGSSVDWDRERFTLDDRYQEAVRETFVTLFEEGLIYRGERMIQWCPRCSTGLSDLEVEHEEHEGHLWYIRYPELDGGPGVVVATTRPETMLGDTAVAVNPDDQRYSQMVGKTVILPLMEREIPIIADDYIDMEFGTGAIKVTPAHDPNDLGIAQRHDLESVLAINRDGEMTEACGDFAGMDRYEAREAVVAALEAEGLLEEVDDYTHSVGHCSRCGTVVEPLVSIQWFVEMEPLAKEGLQAVDAGQVSFVPRRWEKVYRDWLENIRDWCISRQLWWGHPIPVWYCQDCGEMTCTREDPTECAHCGSEDLQQETDVLDTWFSSALWPFATLGWPEHTDDLDYFYPTSVLVTAYDIIYFWVARMVMMGKHMMGQKPFDTVFIHGLVRDETGTKMSKSLGNVVDPLELIDKYGADALRFALLQMITHGQDLTYSEDRIIGARNFCNKLWNASRFVMMNLDEDIEPVDLDDADLWLADRWILSRHTSCLQTLARELDRYNLAQAADALYEHVWSEFCDWYLELAKPDLYEEQDPERRAIVQTILQQVLSSILRALHPFTPYVTEKIWQNLTPQAGSISVAEYPEAEALWRDELAEKDMSITQDVVVTVRNLRAMLKLPPQQRMTVTLQATERVADMLADQQQALRTMASLETVNVQTLDEEPPAGAVSDVAQGVKVFLHIEGAIDPEEELARLEKEIEQVRDLMQQSEDKLSNEGFVNNAPGEIVEEEKRRLQEAEENLTRLREQAETIRGLAG